MVFFHSYSVFSIHFLCCCFCGGNVFVAVESFYHSVVRHRKFKILEMVRQVFGLRKKDKISFTPQIRWLLFSSFSPTNSNRFVMCAFFFFQAFFYFDICLFTLCNGCANNLIYFKTVVTYAVITLF